jgi:hypothetical protein
METYIRFYAQLERILLNIYRSEKCFERRLYTEMKHILYPIHFLSKSYGFRGNYTKHIYVYAVSLRNMRNVNLMLIIRMIRILGYLFVRPACFTLFIRASSWHS